jgi:hypothetical protein
MMNDGGANAELSSTQTPCRASGANKALERKSA